MRVLVLSDSHGDVYKLRRAIDSQPTAKLIVFLGDGEYDIDSVECRVPVIKVRGNCDFGSSLPLNFTDEVCGKKIYCTHGFRENVKYTTENLISAAKSHGAHIALYGHTHVPVTSYDGGLYLVNPGSVREGSFAFIDITDSGIMPIIMKIK